jgi:predicted SAM-dependent methyltransferase
MLFPKAPLQFAAVMAGTIAAVAAQRYNLVDHYDSSNWLNMFTVQSVQASLSLYSPHFLQALVLEAYLN